MFSPTLYWGAIALLAPLVTCQETALPGPQCQDFASSYKLSAEQIAQAGISNITANNVEIALNFERTNWATTQSVRDDPFYRIPSNVTWDSSIPAGTVFAVENVTDTSLYTLPAALSMSRIIYQTATVNGTNIPASAYVLWPYLPRTFPNVTGLPVVGWGHGTSGVLPDCGPSHVKNLWYQFAGPYTLALQGYVVVAPDFAGLGISTTRSSSSSSSSTNTTTEQDDHRILHPYLHSPAHALDILHAVRAARTAFPTLSRSHVVVGHSQGGGAAWSAAVAAAKSPSLFAGFLGAVAGSPTPAGADYLAMLTTPGDPSGLPFAARGIAAAYGGGGGHSLEAELLTAAGAARLALLEQLGGCTGVAWELFRSNGSATAGNVDGAEPDWGRPGFAEHWATRAFAAAIDYAGRDVGGDAPLLVLQGGADLVVVGAQTAESVRRTCAAFPAGRVEMVEVEGVSHVPVMFAAQRVWLDWVADRFNGVPVDKEEKCGKRTVLGPLRRQEGAYLEESNYLLESITQEYQLT